MTNIQQWLEENHSNKKTTTEINLNILKNKDITPTNQLIISDYPNLKKIENDSIKGVQNLIISNLPNLTSLRWVKNELSSIEIINCPQLAEFRCYNNNLTSLNLINCPNLKIIDCSNNLLTKIELPLNTKNLERLYLGNNNFPEQDLSLFKDLVNLKELSIGNYRNTNLKEISAGNYGKNLVRQDTYNRFFGSLEPLVELTKLELLEINNTDINSGLEYLTDTVTVYCLTEENSKVKVIYEQLEPYNDSVKAWQQVNSNLVITTLRKQLKKTKEEKTQLEEQLQTEKEEFKKFQDKSVEYQQARENKIKELEQENVRLQEQLTNLQQSQVEINPNQK